MQVQSMNDAAFCGKVPLHQTNLIQPHGFLLVADKDFRFIQVSENVQELFGREARQVINTSLQDFLPVPQANNIKQRLQHQVSGRLPFMFSLSTGKFLATIKTLPGLYIIEVFKGVISDEQEESFLRIYQDLKYVMAAIERAQTTEETCRIVIEELKKISGFDKIMIYRFDESWNGDVIAEINEEGMDNYLGLKFPASDIPAQARQLYKNSPYRFIPNVNYEPVKLYPVINPVTNAFTDLSDSNLRSVAGVHLEYLRNMKVVASMSTRILQNDKLWGLIACHHRTPKYLSFETSAVFELLSDIISNRITAMENKKVFDYKTRMQQLHTLIIEETYSAEDLGTGLEKNKTELLKLLSADGVAVIVNHKIDVFGKVPPKAQIEDLVIWLQSIKTNKLFHQPFLSSVYEPAKNFTGTGSGIVALPIQPDKGDFILAFRGEEVSKVNWGGNPSEAIQFESDGKKYHPRASFNKWQQEVHKHSIPWRPEELEVAESFRNFILEYKLNNQFVN